MAACDSFDYWGVPSASEWLAPPAYARASPPTYARPEARAAATRPGPAEPPLVAAALNALHGTLVKIEGADPRRAAAACAMMRAATRVLADPKHESHAAFRRAAAELAAGGDVTELKQRYRDVRAAARAARGKYAAERAARGKYAAEA